MQNKFSTGTSGVINPLDRVIIKKIIHMNTATTAVWLG